MGNGSKLGYVIGAMTIKFWIGNETIQDFQLTKTLLRMLHTVQALYQCAYHYIMYLWRTRQVVLFFRWFLRFFGCFCDCMKRRIGNKTIPIGNCTRTVQNVTERYSTLHRCTAMYRNLSIVQHVNAVYSNVPPANVDILWVRYDFSSRNSIKWACAVSELSVLHVQS